MFYTGNISASFFLDRKKQAEEVKLLCVVLQDDPVPELCEPTNDAFAFSANAAE